MNCTECELYSSGLKRCIIGKANPRTLKNTTEVAITIGLYGVCLKNDYRRQVFVNFRSEGKIHSRGFF